MSAAKEFQKRKWVYVYGDRYELETKIEYKERNGGKSPNESDSIMIAVEGARRRGFKISKVKSDEPEQTSEWIRALQRRQETLRSNHSLTYS